MATHDQIIQKVQDIRGEISMALNDLQAGRYVAAHTKLLIASRVLAGAADDCGNVESTETSLNLSAPSVRPPIRS